MEEIEMGGETLQEAISFQRVRALCINVLKKQTLVNFKAQGLTERLIIFPAS